MSITQKWCMIVYTVVLIQCILTTAVIYMKAQKSAALFSLTACQALVGMWLFFGMIENMSGSTAELHLTMRLTLFPIFFIGSAWLIFSMYYSEILPKNSKWNVVVSVLVLVPPAVCYVPVVSKPWFHYIVIHKEIENPSITVWGPVASFMFIFSYTLIVISFVLMIIRSVRMTDTGNGHFAFFIAATVVPAVLSVGTFIRIIPDPGFDLTPPSFSMFFTLISVAILKYRILDIVPLAAYDLFRHTEEAVLLLDSQERIIEYNHAAERQLAGLVQLQNCREMGDVLSALKAQQVELQLFNGPLPFQSEAELAAARTGEGRPSLPAPASGKHFSLYVKPVTAPSGKPIGSILALKDMTDYHNSTLKQERKRLSSDIHDTLGSRLAIIVTNLTYAIHRFDDREGVKECIEASYASARSGLMDLRRIIEELTPLEIEQNGLMMALHGMFQKLRVAGIRVDFTCPPFENSGLDRGPLAQPIYNLCLEALNNAVFHGKAECITVTIVQTQDELKLYILDDGIGCSEIHKGRGLTAMEERVKELGGIISFGSPSDGGFNIKVSLPVLPIVSQAVISV